MCKKLFEENSSLIIGVLILGLMMYICQGGYSKVVHKRKDLLYYYRPTCPFCVKFTPTWERLEEYYHNTNVVLRKINCSTHPDLCSRETDMPGVPFVVCISGGKKYIFRSNRTEESIKSFVSAI
jgi:thioredoxin-like negative regulator of GroEL